MQTIQTVIEHKLTFWEKNLLSKLTTDDPQLRGQHDFVDVYFYQPSIIRNLENAGLIETNCFKDEARITQAGIRALTNNMETGILNHSYHMDTQNG